MKKLTVTNFYSPITPRFRSIPLGTVALIRSPTTLLYFLHSTYTMNPIYRNVTWIKYSRFVDT